MSSVGVIQKSAKMFRGLSQDVKDMQQKRLGDLQSLEPVAEPEVPRLRRPRQPRARPQMEWADD